MRFGDFVAVDGVSLRIRRGEIFGFLGSNGCGKTTTMKMLTGLLPASAGNAAVRPCGRSARPGDAPAWATGAVVLALWRAQRGAEPGAATLACSRARSPEVAGQVAQMAQRFGLDGVMDELPERLPLGMRQRLSLAVAMVHAPELLILDEPTSGVDPVARDQFWRLLVGSRRDRVTIFISTHFMNEAERCDRVSLMHAGRVLDSDQPAAIVARRGDAGDAFIEHLLEAGGGGLSQTRRGAGRAGAAGAGHADGVRTCGPQRRQPGTRVGRPVRLQRKLRRACSYLLAQGARAAAATRCAVRSRCWDRSADVRDGLWHQHGRRDLRFAVLDRDQTALSRDYALSLSGSGYFVERPPFGTMPGSIAGCATASSRWRSRSRPVSRAMWRAATGPRSAPGSTAPCPSAPRP